MIKFKQQEIQNQIDMPFAPGKGEKWIKMKNKLGNVEKKFELLPFWKYGLNIFTLVTILFLAITIVLVFFVYYETLPEQIPIIYDQQAQLWDIFPKYVLLILSLVFLLGEVGIYILSYYIYFFDKRLSIVINLISVIVVYLYLIGVAQLLSFELI